jgi:hypothetical protein
MKIFLLSILMTTSFSNFCFAQKYSKESSQAAIANKALSIAGISDQAFQKAMADYEKNGAKLRNSAAGLNPNLASVTSGDSYHNSSVSQIGSIASVITDLTQQTIRLNWGVLNNGTDYHQLWSCPTQNAPCTILEDSEGFAKDLIILTDGSLFYRNAQGDSTAFIASTRQR